MDMRSWLILGWLVNSLRPSPKETP
nr:unnamed protein product [Callosobruchus chinensis]